MTWLLIAVDVFSRKLHARALPSKEVEGVSEAFNDIVEEEGAPLKLNTDNGTEFAKTFDKRVCDMYHSRTFVGDHRALGVVDASIRLFKNSLFKYMTAQGDPSSGGYYSWAKNLPDLVENFNDMPRGVLLNNTPNEVEEDEVLQGVLATLNDRKLKKIQDKRSKGPPPPFEVGEKIRIPAQTGIQTWVQSPVYG
eukprot:Lithocolla_globosa_v1_NODE_7484_length_941_cov_12.996614.p1 type:complete len:194 gc:universal NODE_7484_length_941_cov_12.996614:151-732(+)